MKKRKLKPFVKTSMVLVALIAVGFGITALVKNRTSSVANLNEDFTYVNDYIFDSYYPVINNDEKIIRPYTSESVTIYKNFYDKDATEEEQKNSIVYHEGIYMQNSGVDYKSDEQFDVTSALSGTVTKISDDTLLGKTVEIRNSSEIITLYQSLGEVSVKKGDTVVQGQIIGKSGSCVLNEEVKNGLHFEMYMNGGVINPEKHYDKSVKDIVNN